MVPGTDSTIRPADGAEGAQPSGAGRQTPGLILVYSAGKPMLECLLLDGNPVELGRSHPVFAGCEDGMMSRRHASVAYGPGGFGITDLGSRNGSALDSKPFSGRVVTGDGRVLRLGHSLFLL